MKIVPDSHIIMRPKNRILVKNREDRPATKFVDIGAEFVDVTALTKRAAVAERKARLRAKKAEKRKLRLESTQRTH